MIIIWSAKAVVNIFEVRISWQGRLRDIIGKLNKLSRGLWYWLGGAVFGITLLATGQFYQHMLDHQPCVMCIQVRLWLSLLVVLSISGIFTLNRKVIHSLLLLLVVVVAAGLTERSYQLLGTERGFVFGDCGFDLGMPAWFAVDEWLPWMYRVETSCGYTPELIFGVTMAEALMFITSCLLLLSVCVWLASFLNANNQAGKSS